MPETVAGEDVCERSVEELVAGLEKSFRDIKEGRTKNDPEAIREWIQRKRERRESAE